MLDAISHADDTRPVTAQASAQVNACNDAPCLAPLHLPGLQLQGLHLPSLHLPGLPALDPVVLAPMSGITDKPFRRMARRFGAGLLVTEMVASAALLREIKDSRKLKDCVDDESPISVQLAGIEAETMGEAAKVAIDRGADMVDVNFGCPAKKVTAKASGSALMRDEPRAIAILEAVARAAQQAAPGLPVSVKMRLGWDESCHNAAYLARVAEDLGFAMVVVHGRTRCQFYKGQADWRAVAQVRKAVKLPVLVNGDISDPSTARQALQQSGAAGVMLGRAAEGRPWLIRQVADDLTGRAVQAEPSWDEKRAAVEVFMAEMLEHYGTASGLRNARKHLAWFAHGLPDAAEFRRQVMKADDLAGIESCLQRFFQAPEQQAEQQAELQPQQLPQQLPVQRAKAA